MDRIATTSTVFKSDFKDFRGLHPAVMQMAALRRREVYKNFVVIDNYPSARGPMFDRTPFDLIAEFPQLAEEDMYNLAIRMAEEEGFDAAAVRREMDELRCTSERLVRCMSAAICYPRGHANRRIF